MEAYRFKNTWGSRDTHTRDEQGTSTHDSHEAYRYLWGFGLWPLFPRPVKPCHCDLFSQLSWNNRNGMCENEGRGTRPFLRERE